MNISDYTQSNNSFLEDIIGFKYDSTCNGMVLPLAPYTDDLLLPTNRGLDKLIELNWNFAAQDSIMGMNLPAPSIQEGKFSRIINGLFFDENNGHLITRHIKWIDFIPLEYTEEDEQDKISINISILSNLIEHDVNFIYPLPNEYKYKKLPQINRLIELINCKETSEPDITKFLSMEKNKFIVTMHFGAKNIADELTCEWQSEDKNDIRPDFFVIQTDGYAHILEFKLPDLKSKTVVGKTNRETFSSEINQYISQTRSYEEYFDDPNNREWFEKKHSFKVYKPKRILIAGRRSDFQGDEWRAIQSDYRNIELLTYDDLIDGVVAQFYLG